MLSKKYLSLWLGFVLITLGYIGFRTFYIYKFVHVGLGVALLLLLITLPLSVRFLNRVVILGWPVIAVLAWFLLTLTWVKDPALPLLQTATSFSASIAAFLIGAIWRFYFKPSEVSEFFPVLALGYVMLSAINYTLFGDLMAVEQGSFRTEIAAVIAMTLPVLIARALVLRSIWSACIAIAISALAIYGQSRTTLMILVLAVCILGVMHFRARLIPAYLVGFVTLMAGLTVLPSEIFDRLSNQTQLEATESAIAEELSKPSGMQVDLDRRIILLVAKNEFLDHMAFGIGYMGLSSAVEKHFGRSISAHGLIPALLAEIGLVGGVILLVTLARSFSALRWSMRRSASIVERTFISHMAVSLALLVVFGVFHQLVEYPIFWLLVGFALMGGKMPSRNIGIIVRSATD